jgi:hypothetical protein
MRRHNYPYTSKRYVLNKNTFEIHDLDRETSHCRINEIKTDHVFNCDSYVEAEMFARMYFQRTCNGCAYCMPEKNTG